LRVDFAHETRNLVAQRKATLLEAAQQQFIQRDGVTEAINGGVKVRVVNSQLNELPGQ